MNADESDLLVTLPKSGRVFTATRRVSVDDAAPDGRMQFDAIARFLQDAGNDDTDDVGLDTLGLTWIARRLIVEIHEYARSRELLTLRTWCSGTGKRWAERRTEVTGERGAHIECAAIWVHIDARTGRIAPWNDAFGAAYLEATGGRQVNTRLHHSKDVPDLGAAGVNEMPFRFRASDMDAFEHVNNTAYLAVLEEAFGPHRPPAPLRVEIEWRKPSEAGEELTVVEHADESGAQLWISSTETNELRATIVTRPM